MNIGKAIFELRKKRGMTISMLAQKLGCTESTLNDVELGKTNFSDEFVNEVADILNVPPEFIKLKSMEISDVSGNRRELFKKATPALNRLFNIYLGITKDGNVKKNPSNTDPSEAYSIMIKDFSE